MGPAWAEEERTILAKPMVGGAATAGPKRVKLPSYEEVPESERDVNPLLVPLGILGNVVFIYQFFFTTNFNPKQETEDKRRSEVDNGAKLANRMVERINAFGQD